MAWQDLTTLYRGQPWYGPSRYLRAANQGTPTIMGGGATGLSSKELGRLSGQYWTQDADLAARYAGKKGQIRSMKVPSNYLDKFSKFQNRIINLPSGKYTLAESAGGHLVPKSVLKNYPSRLNLGKTLANYMSHKDYPGKLLKAGWQTMGDDYTFSDKLSRLGKNITHEGLDNLRYFRRNLLPRGLSVLGSLPLQAGLMTLTPTAVNEDEADMTVEDFKKMQMMEDFFSKRKNIPGTPIVPAGARFYGHARGRDEPSGGDGSWSPSGADLSPGGGYGQSPTGSDIAGTPFSRGGILGAF